MFRAWLAFAGPWMVGVLALSIYDHQRAIVRVALERVQAADGAGGTALVHWLAAMAIYVGQPVLYYGLLPAGLTFFLYVVFLPWAERWPSQGTLDD